MTTTFTLDLEDHHRPPNPAPRYPEITYKILDFLSDRGVTGTFFVLGDLAERHPELIRTVHQRGHEIGFHTYAHVPLTRENPERFRDETRRSKAFLEDLTGAEVIGFRAPIFSLTPATLWALPILQELGFRYTSSVLPLRHPLYGFPRAPQQPFRWKDFSLVEIPVPVARIGPVYMPFMGGVYMRYLPDFLLVRALRRQNTGAALWTYCHPYDFDPDEKFVVMREASALVSFVLWLNRGRTFRTVARILEEGVGLPFRDYWKEGAYNSVPVFDPSSKPQPEIAAS
jgi:polysaccharide deacetylase family protein (PEP-CTERM system associated)